MGIYKTSDRLTQCDPQIYSNFYDASKKIDLRHSSIQSTEFICKDTWELSRENLKKEALNRLRHHSKYTIIHTGFMRIGKYLFLAVAFPPYLVIYGLPKWILVEGIPALVHTLATFLKKTKQKVQKQVNALKQKIKEVVLVMQQALQKLISPIIHLSLDINQALQLLRLKTIAQVKLWNHQLKKIAPKRVLNPLKKKMEHFLTRTYEMIIKGIKKAQNWKLQSVNASQTLLSMLQISKLSAYTFHFVNKQAFAWKEKWYSKYELAQTFAEKWLSASENLLKMGFQKTAYQFYPIKKIYLQSIKPFWDSLKVSYFKKKQQLLNWTEEHHQKILQYLADQQEQLKNLTFEQVRDYILLHLEFNFCPHFLRRNFQRFAKNKFIEFILRSLFRSIAYGIHLSLKGSCYFIKFISKGIQVISKGLGILSRIINYIFNFLYKIYALFLRCLILILNHGRKYLRKFVYSCLLVFMMISIVTIWGINLLGEQMSSLVKLFPRATKSSADC
ncbi:hypothetical protein [Candidatus Protochlamydia sp. W-9]|uniref:hypothetical protein n=1 Tax=Candidatus Protochlamydia sp. W-9 TaxID=1785087 RepID=UPI00096A35F4|nr:hypothetical protein [Candidatus Protochlamydia sp. W-9]